MIANAALKVGLCRFRRPTFREPSVKLLANSAWIANSDLMQPKVCALRPRGCANWRKVRIYEGSTQRGSPFPSARGIRYQNGGVACFGQVAHSTSISRLTQWQRPLPWGLHPMQHQMKLLFAVRRDWTSTRLRTTLLLFPSRARSQLCEVVA